MPKTPKDKNQAEADKRRDELAKRVLKMPPKPKTAKSHPGHKTGQRVSGKDKALTAAKNIRSGETDSDR